MLDALVAEARLRFGLDPASGLQIAAADALVATPIEPSRPLLIIPSLLLAPGGVAPGSPRSGGGAGSGGSPAVAATALPGRAGPGGDEPAALLRRLYPSDHPVGRFGTSEPTTVGALSVEELASPCYLAPLPSELAGAGPWAMPWISARLRQPDGCPWDREQTHGSLRNHLLEEAYEVYDALESGPTMALAGELGDLWLQVVLHAQLAAEAGAFDLTDVQAAITDKIVRRHPHVFADAEARTAGDVNRQWERIKAEERAAAGGERARESALDGISTALPALAASQEMQERAAHLGYDWPSLDGVLDKVVEETDELREAAAGGDPAAWAEEFGDLLFVLVNVARRQGIQAEAAVRAANAKFRRRFGSVERQAAARGVTLRELDFAALDELWNVAKSQERMSP
ncbi:MAG: nucleoside triphosphate pyrophosphohydrolase [Candidatus Limnocylindrales bacterium]